MSPLKSFLTKAKAAATSITSSAAFNEKLSVVIGNEAADADSIISALTYAYLKQQQQASTSTSTTTLPSSVIPLCCIPKKDLKLRRDIELLLQKTDIDINELICLDDFPTLSSSTLSELILVDHNNLSQDLSHLSSFVTEIVDHHKDMNAYPNVSGDKRYIILF